MNAYPSAKHIPGLRRTAHRIQSSYHQHLHHHHTMKFELSTLALAASTAHAARFILHIPTTPLVNPSTLPPTTHATLQSSGEPLDAHLTRSNSFQFTNVSAGSYLATVHCRDFLFEPLRIDVSIEEAVEGSGDKKEVVRAWQTFLGNEWDNKGESRGEGGNGAVIEVKPMAPKQFYQERGGCKDSLYIISGNGANTLDRSLPVIVFEKSYDSHGNCIHGLGFRNAVFDGE